MVVYTKKLNKIFILLLSAIITFSYVIPINAYAEGENEGGTTEEVVKEETLHGATVKINRILSEEDDLILNASYANNRESMNLIFKIDELQMNFPYDGQALVGKTISIIYTEGPVGEDGKPSKDWLIKDWSLSNSEPEEGVEYFEDVVVLYQMRFSENHVHQYDIESFENEKYDINRVNFFDTRVDPKHLYDNNYAGARVKVYGVMSTTDDKTMDVRNWIILSPDEKEVHDEDRDKDQIYGTVTELSYRDGNTAYAMFKADGGQHYMTAWDLVEFGFYESPPIGSKMTLNVEYTNKDAAIPAVNVLDYEIMGSKFEYKTGDVLSITGIATELMTSEGAKEDGSTTVTYKFNSNGVNYYAAFDSTVLGEYERLWTLEGKKIEITGVVYKEGSTTFIGVASYRDPFASIGYGEDFNGSNLSQVGDKNVTALTVTNITVVSYDETTAVYKGITTQGIEHYFIYSKDLLGSKYPTDNLIGSTYRVTVIQSTASKEKNMYYVKSMVAMDNVFEKHRGTITELVVEGTSTGTYMFESITGQKMKIIMNNASIELVGDAEDLVGVSGTIYGKFANVTGENLFDVYNLAISKAEQFSEKKDDTVTFRGTIKELVGSTGEGLLFYATNQYGQAEYLYFELDYMKEYLKLGISIEALMAGEITITGIRTSEYIMVKSFGKPEVPNWYPTGLESKIVEPEYFPNLKGWTGFLEVSDIAGEQSQLVLVTAKDRYVLNGSKKVMAKIEANLGNIVYLRGEYREAGAPYWTGEIKVYDLQFLERGTDDNVIYADPIGEEVPDLMPDPQKPAIHTIQLHDKPAEFEYGDAIIEALYFPEIIQVEMPSGGKK